MYLISGQISEDAFHHICVLLPDCSIKEEAKTSTSELQQKAVTNPEEGRKQEVTECSQELIRLLNSQ